MKSISWKILRTTLCMLGVIIVLMTGISIFVVNKISETDSKLLLKQVCEKESLRYNDQFILLENSVTTISKYIQGLEGECSSTSEMLSDGFCKKVLDMTLSIANRTDGAMAAYFRYNPALTGNGTKGFFLSRENNHKNFYHLEPTDILQYDKNDVEHVGWFYEPEKRRQAIWMSPYYNKNLDVFMISYVIPYYTSSGDFLGVIGMDIDFNVIVQLTNHEQLYKSGSIQLADFSTYLVYQADKSGTVKQEKLSVALYDLIAPLKENNAVLNLKNESGKKILTCVSELQNGMKIMINLPASEVYAQRNMLGITFAIIMAAVIAITVFFIVRLTNKMVNPLKKLTRITEKYANGNWSETFVCDTGDEIQELSESISVMAETTKSFIEKLDESSNTDALTSLKNRNCYLSYIQKFKKTDQTAIPEYAVVMFDVNYLKKANDSFGHKAGDDLLKLAGGYICDIFEHSPVFRIGGDEYIAILENRDFRIRKLLCQEFEEQMKNLPVICGDIPLSVSYGMGVSGEDGSSYEEVFKKADERMYAFKKAMKAERE